MNPRTTVSLFLLCLLASCFFGLLETRPARATVTETKTFTSDASVTGQIYASSSNYTTANNAGTGTPSTGLFNIGQLNMTSYYIYRGFAFWDTSSLTSDANITSVVMSIYVYTDYSDTDFNVTVQNGQPSYPHKPKVSTDYDKTLYSGSGGSRNTTTIGGGGWTWWNITLNASGLSWISKTGYTKLALRSSRDIASTAPQLMEYVECGYVKLYVTYELPNYTNRYVIYGPYYEDGTVANCFVNLTLARSTNSSLSYTLNGTDGAVDTLSVNLTAQPTFLAWNITTGTNNTRIHFFTSDTYEEIYIYVPKPTSPAYLYTFTVIDFAGVTDAYLETLINDAGNSRVVERQALMTVNAIPFWMEWSHRYDLRVVCDQGSYTWGGFIALSESTQNLVISIGMFPTIYPGQNMTVTASRPNGTYISVNYTDGDSQTVWCYIAIQYRNGSTYATSYSTNSSGNTHSVAWNSAVNTTDYRVYVLAYRTSGYATYYFSLARPPYTVNPWDILDVFGTWPIDSSQIVGIVIVIGVWSMFSYENATLGCGIGVILAGILCAIGWLVISSMLLALAFVLVGFLLIAEYRKSMRYEGLEA